MKIIDDFLPQKEFQKIQSMFMETNSAELSVGWEYTYPVTSNDDPKKWKYFYMTHMIYIKGIIVSPLYNKMIPIFKELDVKALIRIKCNLYPNSEELHEHTNHTDYPFSHKAAIIYINTCDGYTKLADGTKVDSVENRVLLFDASNPHCSTTTSDATARFNINFNYF